MLRVIGLKQLREGLLGEVEVLSEKDVGDGLVVDILCLVLNPNK
jgi:hypothetical protein